MTREEAAAHSVAEYQKDRHSRGLPGSGAGPNKAGRDDKPTGASELATELGGEADAQRARTQAIREGDELPREPAGGVTEFGLPNGAELGVRTPGEEGRERMQQSRNAEFSKEQPDLLRLARTSQASAAHHPTRDASAIHSTATRRADDVLETVSRSVGTESGTGAASDGAIEVGRDAQTSV